MSAELFNELFKIESEFIRVQKYNELLERARLLGVKGAFEKLYNAYKKDMKKNSTKIIPNGEEIDLENSKVTSFSCLGDDDQLFCGLWDATDDGIKMQTEKGQVLACSHPIFPLKILRNAEEGTYKIELGFFLRGQLRKTLVDKSTIASSTKILALADQSVLVNSVNAQFLVKYLSDIEALNEDKIAEKTSTSKLGWITDKNEKSLVFIPYDRDVTFDNEQKMKQLFNSIRSAGDPDEWYSYVKKIRAENRIEFLLSLDAAYASALIELCGGLPFVFDLYGTTSFGKSVILTIVSSVWGCPQEYMADSKSTPTAMEIRLNTLNSLPMCLDDLAQLSQTEDDFGKLIYAWCSGQPKERSNTSLGLSKGGRWRNIIITNGERPLATETMQGGAVNRIIDLEVTGKEIFDGRSGNEACTLVKENYGHSGSDWIFALKGLGCEKINEYYKKWFDTLREKCEKAGKKTSDKQIMAMAFLCTAHELTTMLLFRDGIQLDIDRCVDIMKDLDEVDENKRAYEVVVSAIEANDFHFRHKKDEPFEKATQCWGFYLGNDWIAILPNVFDQLLKESGFQPKSFKSWCAKQGKLQSQGKHFTRVFKDNGSSRRYIVFKASFEEEEEIVDTMAEIEFQNLTSNEVTPFD